MPAPPSKVIVFVLDAPIISPDNSILSLYVPAATLNITGAVIPAQPNACAAELNETKLLTLAGKVLSIVYDPANEPQIGPTEIVSFNTFKSVEPFGNDEYALITYVIPGKKE